MIKNVDLIEKLNNDTTSDQFLKKFEEIFEDAILKSIIPMIGAIDFANFS